MEQLELENRLRALEQELWKYKQEQRQKELSSYKAGIMTLGGIVLALLAFVFHEIIWPVIKSGQGK